MESDDFLTSLLEESDTVETVKQACAFFCSLGVIVRHLSARTKTEYSKDLDDLAAFLEKRNVTMLARVRLSHLQRYQYDLEQRGLSLSTRNRKTDCIKTFFRFLHEQDILPRDIAEQLIPPPLQPDEPRILTEDEYTRLVATCASHPRDRAIIVLYLQTGMKLSELIRLKTTDIELPEVLDHDEGHTGSARIIRSSGKTERIPLNYKACEALTAYLRGRPKVSSSALFLNRFDESLSKRRVQYLVTAYLERIGITGASVQTLRHTMAAHHIAQGTDLQVIQETLGISVAATEKYLTLAKKTARKALQDHAL